MVDLRTLSNEDLDALIAEKQPSTSSPVQNLTDEELDGLIAEKSQQSQGSWTKTMQSRGADIADVIGAYKSGEQTLPETIYQGLLKSTLGTLSDVGGEALSAVTPELVKQKLAPVGQYIAEQPIVQRGVEEFGKLSPRQQRNIEATGLLPVGAAARMVGKLAAPVAKDIVKGAEKIIQPAQKVLPKEFEPFQPLIEAKGWAAFSKTPNDLEIGKKANNAISQQYEIAKNKIETSQNALKSTPIDIEAPDFIPEVKKSLGAISQKIAPESDDGRALKVLRKIINQEGGKKAPSTTAFGVADKPQTINSNFALDIRQNINKLLESPTFPNTSRNALLKVKNMADKVLDKEAVANPEFAEKWINYKADAQDIASRFTNNNSLKKFWQPEDYVTWKAAQNNPVLSEISNASLSRANKTLANLNTKNAGEVKAVIDALPSDLAKEVMRKAVIKANKEKISLTNAIAQSTIGLNPGAGLRTAVQSFVKSGPKKEVPINKLIEDINKLKIEQKP